MLVATIDVEWEGMGDVGSARYAGTTSPMPDHKGFEQQELVNFQKFITLRVNLQQLYSARSAFGILHNLPLARHAATDMSATG